MITCTNCNTQNEDGSAFCSECGMALQTQQTLAATSPPIIAAVEQTIPPPPVEKKIFCRNCGNTVNENAFACMGCGLPPYKGKGFCQGCGAGTHEEAIICVKCGIKLQNEQTSKPVNLLSKFSSVSKPTTDNTAVVTAARSITSVTYILIGNMLSVYSNIAGSFITVIATNVLGIIFFFVGLSRLKASLDETGQSGVSKLITSTILSIIAALIGFIPLLGFIPALILSLISFILQITGLLKLKNSETLSSTGAGGVNYLLTAIILMIIAGLFHFIPFAGSYIVAVISFIAIILILFGWIKIQEAIIEKKG